MANYPINLQHPDKINIVPNALNRKPIAIFLTLQKELLEEIRQLELEIVLPGIETNNDFATLISIGRDD